MKYYFLSFLLLNYFLLLSQAAIAQEEDDFFSVEDETAAIAVYDLQGCLDYALSYSEQLKLSQLNVRTAEAEVGENIARGLPQIDANIGFQDNFKIQRSFVPAFLFDPDAEEGDFIPVQFQPKFSGTASVTLQQLIFDFSYLIGLKAARMYTDLEKTRVELSKTEVKANVKKAYYGVLVTQERLGLLEQNYKRLDTLFRETKALQENGFAELLDVQRTEVAFNNIQVELTKAKGAIILARQILKFQMGMPMRDSLIVEGSLSSLDVDPALPQDQRLEPRSRLEYQILEQQIELRNTGLRYNKSLYYPSLYGVVAYGSNTGVNSFGDLWRFNQNWFGFGYYGLQINIPIMDGFKRKHTFSKLRVDIERAELQMKQFEKSAQFEVDQSLIYLAESKLNLQNQDRNRKLASEVARVTKIKYQNGVGSNFEVVEAQTDLQEAETNYYTTLYEALIRQVDLDKALGNL